MGRSPCCDEEGLKKGPWTSEEDTKLIEYIQNHGHGSWRALPKNAGLNRCGKSCRLRWTNYLRPDIRRGKFSDEEERLIIQLHSTLGNKWSAIAARLPGRTDNEIKNYWNTHLKKKLLQMGIDPVTHRPRTDLSILANLQSLLAASNLGNLPQSAWSLDNALRIHADAAQAARIQILQSLIQAMVPTNVPNVDLVRLMGAAMVNQPGRLFTSLLGGEAQANAALTSLTTLQMAKEDLLPPAVSSIPGSSSKATTGVENNVSFSVSEMSSSVNNSVASPSLENFSLDQFQEMINSNDGSSSSSLEPWDAQADTENFDLCWRDILAQMPLPPWPMTSEGT